MSDDPSTCWTVIRGAAAGRGDDRDTFARTYENVVRTYLLARWHGTRHRPHVEDGAQEVFLDCFREGGALERADPERGDFRAFLYGVTRNVARRFERTEARRKVHGGGDGAFDPDREAADDPALSRVFDRAWARALIREAAQRQARSATDDGARRRVELLRLRFEEGLPIREIAAAWEEDPARIHRLYAAARREFENCLLSVVAFHHDAATPADLRRSCRDLVALLG